MRLRVPRFVFVFLAVAASTRALASAEPPALDGDPPGVAQSARRYLVGGYPAGVWTVGRETLTGASLLALAVAGVLVPLIDDHDAEVQRKIRTRRPTGDAIHAGEWIGQPPALFLYPIAVAAAGHHLGSDRLVTTAATLLEAVSVAQLVSFALKLAVRRERPDGSNELSFPSNHAAGGFALATVAAGRHGPFVGVPAFLAAAFAATARMEADKHFLSDTVFATALGTVVGLSALAARPETPRDEEPESPPPSAGWRLGPMALRDGGGVAVGARW